MPRVSVLMTVYNGMPFLPAAVDSILGQSFSDFEFVIVNDGSTDGTADYLASISDRRVKVVDRENGGTAAAANEGLQHCTGEFTARMDSDDVSLPTRLAEQVAFLDAHSQVGLVGAQMAPLGDAGVGKSLVLPLAHREVYQAMLDGRHGLGHSCIMLRTELLRRIGGYWKLRHQDAWDMMLRMGEVAELANLDRVLHHYRVHRGSLNGKGMRRLRFSIDYARELARRRREDLPPIEADEFQAQLDRRPWLVRVVERVDVYARSHYRLALAEIYGGRKARGYARMAWAAMCQPKLTAERVMRMVVRRFPSTAARRLAP
jgi:glycosyltransferase involved in cell wall biosynthesis